MFMGNLPSVATSPLEAIANNKGLANGAMGYAWQLAANKNPFFDVANAKNDIQGLNFQIINQALSDMRKNTKGTKSWSIGNGKFDYDLDYKGNYLSPSGNGSNSYYIDRGKAGVSEDQQNLLSMLSQNKQGSTAYKDLLGKMRNEYMNRYEGEQKGTQAQLERMRKLGLASQAPTATTPAGNRALTEALQTGGNLPTIPMQHKGRDVLAPYGERMGQANQQQQPTQQQPQTQGSVYGGFGQSPLTQAIQSGPAQVTSNRYRPLTNWGAGGFRSVLSGF